MFKDDNILLKAEIIAIGNEVVSGLIQDTNARYLSSQLHLLGVNVIQITAVGDNEESIVRAVEGALGRADVIITTGGLGSTHDDITKEVLARMFHSKIVVDQKAVAMLEVMFKKRKRDNPEREIPEGVRRQSEVPEAATVLYNDKGTAPGLLFNRDGKKVFSLPGVPLEMEHLFEKYIRPDLLKSQSGVIGHRMLKTVGLTEASLWGKFGPVDPLEKLVTVASLPSYLEVKMRLSFCAASIEAVEARLGEAEAMVMAAVGEWVYGKDDETLEGKIGEWLRDKGWTLAVAESCTGGLIGHRLTQVSGSSDYFLEGAVTYSNEAKCRRLGVEPSLIRDNGAVSREIALAMAKGVRKSSGANIGLSVTGVAGPGASDNKPAGTVFIAISDGRESYCEQFRFYHDRSRNKERSAQAALDLLRRWLLNLL
ncbi:MAG: competence/damage-inducible protein A [Nitrospinaceae bacterium]|jgi:nicotinamide-nucleotide amidase|nr:competence/damage-inducible protein A [Nitrospinaceae bacterium]|tara:strand:- start:700 stop:1974 length:1275 start_codon:yes stop_codon:yes gene_type:complete